MSSVYNLEPPTSGKVLLKTNYGDIDIELWTKETPKACRNFIQLCMEGYYDQTIFHRIIPNFMIQGGDPEGTGEGGESIFGKEGFMDEFHSRLRFNKRGMVAMANSNKPHSNRSQFFITLDKCDFLQNKHTIFGKVTGNTIFNVIRLGELNTDSNDRPLDPAILESVEILNNPFDDIIPRDNFRKKRQLEEDAAKANKDGKKKKKA